MSKSFGDRKVHAGQIKKMQNEIENKEKERLKKEAQEAREWEIGSKKKTGNDERKIKQAEREAHKKKLKKIYEEEMRNL